MPSSPNKTKQNFRIRFHSSQNFIPSPHSSQFSRTWQLAKSKWAYGGSSFFHIIQVLKLRHLLCTIVHSGRMTTLGGSSAGTVSRLQWMILWKGELPPLRNKIEIIFGATVLNFICFFILLHSGHGEWDDGTKTRCRILWRKPEQLAVDIYAWAEANGYINSVCTVYELHSGKFIVCAGW